MPTAASNPVLNDYNSRIPNLGHATLFTIGSSLFEGLENVWVLTISLHFLVFVFQEIHLRIYNIFMFKPFLYSYICFIMWYLMYFLVANVNFLITGELKDGISLCVFQLFSLCRVSRLAGPWIQDFPNCVARRLAEFRNIPNHKQLLSIKKI